MKLTPITLADTFLRHSSEEETEEVGRIFWKAPSRSLFSPTAQTKLVRAFGASHMGLFRFYDQLRAVAGGAPLPEGGLVDLYRAQARLVVRFLAYEPTKGMLADVSGRIRPLLHRIDMGQGSRLNYTQAAEMLSILLAEVAADQGVHLAPMSSGSQGWPALRIMNPSEEKLDVLRRNDPATYTDVMQSKTLIKRVDEAVVRAVQDAGLVPSRQELLGRPVTIGKDPLTNEEYVFDRDGDIISVDQFREKRRKELDQMRGSEKIFPDINEARDLSDEELEEFVTGEVEYIAMTDDKAKQKSLTRIYPVKTTIDGRQVVVAGRYKGYFIDSLVTSVGRMIEGVAYDLDPKSGIPVAIETRNQDGTPSIRANREPYVTVTGNLLYLRIPGSSHYTQTRNAVKSLAKLVPSLRYEEKSRNAIFTFEPKDFAAVREALGGVALSSAAVALLRAYFAQMAKHELATKAENLKHFDTDKIGGFKSGVRLYIKQKEAMAWIESRGVTGVIALDTGVGKTSTALASMQKLVRDQAIQPGQKFLYVCPVALRGNLSKEAVAFLEDAGALMSQVEVMGPTEFTKLAQTDPSFANKYAAIYVDEAQMLKNPTSGVAAALMSINHNRKVLFTASPMEKSPMEAFVLAAISENKNLNTPEGRAEMRAFRKRFCEEVGGKIIGIKNDPLTRRDYRVWMKQHIFYADKRDVEEVSLPQLRATSRTTGMSPEIDTLYRETATTISSVLEGMIAKYRDRDPHASDPAIESARIKLARVFKRLYDLANFPEKFVPGAPTPKLDEAVNLIDERISSGRRTLLFTDSPEFAEKTARVLSERFPMLYHAEAQAGQIRIWQSGKVAATYGPKEYSDGSRTWGKKEWKTYVLDKVISAKPEYVTCVLTSTYAVGQNLQKFDTVVHLDRDAWNNETMKQRTARAWRQGQDHSVDEVILDAVYNNPQGNKDETLDQIIGHLQQLEHELFDETIVAAQTEALGKEWFDMKQLHSSFIQLNRKVMALMSSPYAQNLGALQAPPTPRS